LATSVACKAACPAYPLSSMLRARITRRDRHGHLKTGRRGYGLELDPRYVDVAVRRWQDYTSDLMDDALPFAQ
jgi:hypothetical protein